MEQLNPQHTPFPLRQMPNIMPTGLGNPANPGLLPPYGAPSFPSNMPRVSTYPSDQDEKKKQFARGVFVSGFEKCVTTAMIQHHFGIKPIHGLKHPMTKFKESKGFAFIYYGSEDDALYVKKTLDRTAILKEKIRITRTVISENLSKMMFKLKTHGFSEKEIQENETKYFTDENLQKEVQRIIKPLFGTCVEVNKVTIPRSKADKNPLRYARVFFYVSDVREGGNIAKKVIETSDSPPPPLFNGYDANSKNEYEVILNCISNKINADETFSKIAKSEIYEYTKKNQSNVLHLKGVKTNPKEDPSALADQIKEFMQMQSPQWNIANAYAAIYEKRGAWANITFSTYEETVQAYQHLKNLRPKFRDNIVYGSLRNIKDPRTVVISVVRKDVTEKDVERFLNELAAKSVKTNPISGEEPIRKYDYFSFNIIESKKFFKVDGDSTLGVTEADKDKIHPSWIEINEVPRRLIIHFYHEFTDEDIKELNNDITVTPEYENIFLKGDTKKQLRSNHQKGHVNKDGVYIKHTDIRGKKKVKQPKVERPRRGGFESNPRHMQQPRGQGQFSKPLDFNMAALPLSKGNVPKIGTNVGGQHPSFRPAQIGGGMSNLGNMPPSSMPPGNLRSPPPFNPPSQPYMGGTNMPNKPPPFTFPGFQPGFQSPPMNIPQGNVLPQGPNLLGMSQGPSNIPPMFSNPNKGMIGQTPPPMGQFPPFQMSLPKPQPPPQQKE